MGNKKEPFGSYISMSLPLEEKLSSLEGRGRGGRGGRGRAPVLL